MEPKTQMTVWIIYHPNPRRLGGGHSLCTWRVSCLAPSPLPPPQKKKLTTEAELILAVELRPQEKAEIQDDGGDILPRGGTDLGEEDKEGKTLNPIGPQHGLHTHPSTHSFILSSP